MRPIGTWSRKIFQSKAPGPPVGTYFKATLSFNITNPPHCKLIPKRRNTRRHTPRDWCRMSQRDRVLSAYSVPSTAGVLEGTGKTWSLP